jgi:hypothetical protein
MIDEDGSGEVHADELLAALSSLGEGLTQASAQAMIDKVDRDKSGTLGFAEFVLVMTNGEVDLDRIREEEADGEDLLSPAAVHALIVCFVLCRHLADVCLSLFLCVVICVCFGLDATHGPWRSGRRSRPLRRGRSGERPLSSRR